MEDGDDEGDEGDDDDVKCRQALSSCWPIKGPQIEVKKVSIS